MSRFTPEAWSEALVILQALPRIAILVVMYQTAHEHHS